ncbi:hypothetical protein Q7P37_000148 [Cladosporium fusiforme]
MIKPRFNSLTPSQAGRNIGQTLDTVDISRFLTPHCGISAQASLAVHNNLHVPSLTMHEFVPGGTSAPFSGQLGFIHFTTSMRLPRHIHMDLSKQKRIAERILVLSGVGLVEWVGEFFVVAPDSLVKANGGAPYAWTALLMKWTMTIFDPGFDSQQIADQAWEER